MPQTLPWVARQRMMPIPRPMKIYWWLCVAMFVAALVVWPLALLALPMMLVFTVWFISWIVRERKQARR